MNMRVSKKETNLFSILQLGCTFRVTYSGCRKGFFVLEKHYIWLRATMTTTRLLNLQIMRLMDDFDSDLT